MDVFKAIETRRSIRKYKDKSVDKKKILKVLEAARLAPSAANRQPWTFIVVTDPEAKERLRAAYNRDWFISSPIIIVACADPDIAWRGFSGQVGKEEYWRVDVAIAMQNLVLAAWEEGLGTCWIAAFNEEEAKEALRIPNTIEVVAMTPLGYPDEMKEPVTNRKPLEEIVCYDGW